ncbi:hypothetical protein ACIPSA_16035 [Streptomyces sp. NPDC086549]|uniref:hypothetical protein n=1 Tax=Streptomyces sp. NPDC086549 TaxID=3365752 RepID=UPI00380A69EC
MTQSGQGEPAREGIVLPSDGGEPVLPGMSGGSAPLPPAAPAEQSSATAPSGGQAWGRPWGPEQQQAHQPGEGWPPAAAQAWGTPEQQPEQWSPQGASTAPGAGPLPPEGAPATYGGQNPAYGPGDHGAGSTPYASGAPQSPYGSDPYQQPYAQTGQAAGPLPPAVPDAYAGAGGYPPAGADGATQYIPPVPAAPVDEGATQYLPPVPAAGPAPVDEGATQYIPPVTPGSMPSVGGSDADATQYIAPVAAQYGGGDRQPPSEFDNLFRSGPGAESAAGSTQQLPRVPEAPGAYPGYQQPSYTPPGPGGGRRQAQDGDGGGRGGGRTGSKLPLIAAVGVGIAILGIGAGALLGGGGGGDNTDANKNVAASAPATDGSASAAADPAKQQAVELDKLLADSGSSRASVIRAVANVKACNNLDSAASDLRDAAKQRTELVTRLSKLSVDKLPDNAALTTALTKAWEASASADNHYAAWADQSSGKGCKRGQARFTGQTRAGNNASGTASTQKVTASQLWNAIAGKYGLTQRQPTQL